MWAAGRIFILYLKIRTMKIRQKHLLLVALGLCSLSVTAQQSSRQVTRVRSMAEQVEPQVISWRRHFHEHPELSNREAETAARIASELQKMGIEVETGVAKTGVVGILKGGKPGPVVALRADIDALPVTERADLPFASKAKGVYNGNEVGVMHACGHDTHVAMLLGAAKVLSGMQKELKGTIKFIFQPAEEGAPAGEDGGARLMVQEGVLEKGPKPEVIFGLHINSQTEVGTLKYRPGGIMASADVFRIKVKGRQVHGASPWAGVDPVVVSSQIVLGLQTIISRQTELTENAAVVTVGMIHGGVRNNIIPEVVELEGTIRALDKNMQQQIHEKIRRTATKIAESAGATAEVEIVEMAPVTYNDPNLTQAMLPTLQAVAGQGNVVLMNPMTGAEDFAYFQQELPGLYLFVGGMPKGQNPVTAPAHHTPEFRIDESGMQLGVETLTNLTLDYMNKK